ncbi:MAG: hypothetical protein RLZZ444_1701 [Pseudomonadota bacterium]|jgi:uncharacterized protein (TIGR00251 family)
MAETAFFRLPLRLTPNGGRDSLDGFDLDENGERYLKARVTAVPEDGKANKALIALLSKKLKVPKSAILILSGETSRKKILRIEADPEDVSERLRSLLGDG